MHGVGHAYTEIHVAKREQQVKIHYIINSQHIYNIIIANLVHHRCLL